MISHSIIYYFYFAGVFCVNLLNSFILISTNLSFYVIITLSKVSS